jgi:hypothetical protein
VSLQPLPQQLFELPLKYVCVSECVKCGPKLSFFSLEPFPPKCFERIKLRLRLQPEFDVGGGDCRSLG